MPVEVGFQGDAGAKGWSRPTGRSLVPWEEVSATAFETRQRELNPCGVWKLRRRSRGGAVGWSDGAIRQWKSSPMPLPNSSWLSAVKKGAAPAPSMASAPGPLVVRSHSPRDLSPEAASQRPFGDMAACRRRDPSSSGKPRRAGRSKE